MSVARNILLFGLYTLLALVIVVMAPAKLPWLDQVLAVVIGFVVFLTGALVHEMYQRVAREDFLGRQILALRRAQAELHEQLNWSRRENKALAEAVEAVVRSGRGPEGPAAVGEAITEVRVLKSLGNGTAPVRTEPVLVSNSIDSQPDPEDLTLPSLIARQPVVRKETADSAPQEEAPAKRIDSTTLPAVEQGLSEEEVLEQVRVALRDDRISFVLQPIVSLPQRKRRFYECFSRVRTEDDATILPERYIAVAEREGLITAIDNMLLFRCVQLVRKIQRRGETLDFFCNISGHTLADEEFFGDFVEFLENNDVLGPNLVFEFTQADFKSFGDEEKRHLRRLARVGCRFSLDQVSDLDLDLEGLAAENVRFVKIEAERLAAATPEIHKLYEAFKGVPINLVVEKIEDEATLVELLEQPIDFGQGFLFGEPRLARPAG